MSTIIPPRFILECLKKDFFDPSSAKADGVSFINATAYPRHPGYPAGGPNGVLGVQEKLLGPNYRSCNLFYIFRTSKNKFMSPNWAMLSQQYKLATMLRIRLEGLDFMLNTFPIPSWKNLVNKSFVPFFLCHDVSAAIGAHLHGFQYVLNCHQIGNFIYERTSFGEELHNIDRELANVLERIAFTNAHKVYFPSRGAKEIFCKTAMFDLEQVNFAENPLYNTLLDFDMDFSGARSFLEENGCAELFDNEKRKNFLVFISIGDFSQSKGLDRCPDFLTAIKRHTKREVIWVALGTQHRSGIYEKLSAESSQYNFKAIFSPKRLSHEIAMALLHYADWFLMLQRLTVFDFSTLEAMKMGKGIILSPVTGNMEFNVNSNILYFDPETPQIDDLVNPINTKSNEYGWKNREAYNQTFSNQHFIKAYHNIYDETIERFIINPRKKLYPSILTADFDKYRDKVQGRDILICGSGRSLNSLTREECKNKVLVALNRAFLSDLSFDFHFQQDDPPMEEQFWEKTLQKPTIRLYGVISIPSHQHLAIDFNSLKALGISCNKYYLDNMAFDAAHDKDSPFLLNDHPVYDMHSVLFSAIQVMVYLGAKSISLAGIDFSSESFSGGNKSSFNKNIFINFEHMCRFLAKAKIPLHIIHSTSNRVNELANANYDDEAATLDMEGCMNKLRELLSSKMYAKAYSVFLSQVDSAFLNDVRCWPLIAQIYLGLKPDSHGCAQAREALHRYLALGGDPSTPEFFRISSKLKYAHVRQKILKPYRIIRKYFRKLWRVK